MSPPRRFGRPKTIRGRLVALAVAVVTASVVLFAVAAYGTYSYFLWKRHDDGLRATASTVSVAFERGITVENGDESHAAHHMLNELRFPNRSFALFDAEGRPFPYDPPESRGPGHEHGPSVHLAPDEVLGLAREHRLLERAEAVALETRRGHHGETRLALAAMRSPTSGAVFYVAAEESDEVVREQTGLLRTTLLASIPFFIVLAWIAGSFLANRSLAPVAEMSRTARSIEASTLGDRLPVANPEDELGQLASVINDLLDRLERAFRQMRQFTADASHELRSPLASVRGEAQVALSRRRREDEYRESLEVILEEAAHMTGIVDDMFTLARADAGEQPLHFEPFYLDVLAAECCRGLRAVADGRGIRLACADTTEEPVEIVGDEALVRRVIVNLLDNAIKYSDPGGEVRASVGVDAGRARLDVSDTGPGIAPEHLGRIFERFYRVDRARSREAGGAGLGLSIVRWAVEAHRGELRVESEVGRGSTFTVLLPLDPRAERVPAPTPARELAGERLGGVARG